MRRALPLLASLGMTALSAALFRGNLLVLSPVLGVWVYALVADVGHRPGFGTCRAARRSSDRTSEATGPARRHTRSPLLLAFTATVWLVAVLTVSIRISRARHAGRTSVAGQFAAAERLFRNGRLVEALATFQSIRVPTSLLRRRAQKHHNIGVICMRLGKWGDAEVAFTEAARCDPADLEAHFNLGRLALRNGEAAKAVEHLTHALGVNGQHVGAQYLSARCYFELARFEEARVSIEQAEVCAGEGNPYRPAIQELKERILRRAPVSD